MRQQLVYDLPTRIFHWFFAALFITAFAIGKTVDDDSSTFSLHMLAGLTIGLVVILRVIWGFLGTRHARFSGYALSPLELVNYLKGVFSGDKRKWAGHNPASSWAAVVMMVFALGLCASGFLMASGSESEALEEIHELLANGFIIVVALHIAGVFLHTLRHRDWIGLSMLDGKKQGVAGDQTITNPHTGVGLVFVVLVVAFAAQLLTNFDPSQRKLSLFGNTLSLGENEDEEHGRR